MNKKEALTILETPDTDILTLLARAFVERQKYWGTEVSIHILNNVQNGGCSENCSYCAQSCSSKAEIETYSMKSEERIMVEAKAAAEAGAFRHCLVFSGKGSSKTRIKQLVGIIKRIKKEYKMEVCVSPGFLNKEDALLLKEAGLNRLNHNLNSSERYYPKICQSHTYQDRLNTLKAAKAVGLQLCSGIIVGMGETEGDVADLALTLRDLEVASIPINFFMPIKGLELKTPSKLSPLYCLKVLCLFRLLNPKAEIRAAAGREMHLRQLQPLAMYAANSLFIDGYLNTGGSKANETIQMIKDAGLTVRVSS